MHPELKTHPDYFKKDIVQLADNVYQAFGFAASNVYMIIGDDGLIIIKNQHGHDWAKSLFECDAHLIVAVGQNGGFNFCDDLASCWINFVD